MACCLMASRHYVNQSWLLKSEVMWYSPDSNSTVSALGYILDDEFEIPTYKITPYLIRTNELMS